MNYILIGSFVERELRKNGYGTMLKDGCILCTVSRNKNDVGFINKLIDGSNYSYDGIKGRYHCIRYNHQIIDSVNDFVTGKFNGKLNETTIIRLNDLYAEKDNIAKGFLIRRIVHLICWDFDQKGLLHFMGYEFEIDGVKLDVKDDVVVDDVIGLFNLFGIDCIKLDYGYDLKVVHKGL